MVQRKRVCEGIKIVTGWVSTLHHWHHYWSEDQVTPGVQQCPKYNLFVWEESVINFGWFLRPEMLHLCFFFGGIVDMSVFWVQVKKFIVSLLPNEIFWNMVNMLCLSKGSDCALFQIFPITSKDFRQVFRVHFLICPFSQERLDESYWNFVTSFA